MNQDQLIISLVSIIIMFIPIGKLLWDFSRIVFRVENNKEDINKLAEKIKKHEDNFGERLTENESKLNNITYIMGRLEEKINSILDKIK
jgi:uncharacterized membrane protein